MKPVNLGSCRYQIMRESLPKNNAIFVKAIQTYMNRPEPGTFCGFTVKNFSL